MNTKLIAFYLPQYHEIQENNEWWEKGFTEWTHVKKATPMYEGHIQPRVPLLNNYYNLMDRDTIIWQSELANNYGIDGFAYYHYWFQGKLLLEKPAENLLKWKEIRQNFFFFWANHTWYKASNGRKKVLIKQTYGKKDDWLRHYEYFKKFFKDRRYIKYQNKPVIGIYAPDEISDYDQMIACWNEEARLDGFGGVYIIENCNSTNLYNRISKSTAADAILLRQPNFAFDFIRNEGGKISLNRFMRKFCRKFHLKYLEKIEYSLVADLELNIAKIFQKEDKKDICFCICSGWDNTPRHGKYGQVIVNFKPSKFGEVLQGLYTRSIEKRVPFLFINAWNEWAEGMILEPDIQFGLSNLENIKHAKECVNKTHDACVDV